MDNLDTRAPQAPAQAGPEASICAARAAGVTKSYGAGGTRVTALHEVSVGFRRGRFTAIMGPSGSGKSTLLHCLAGLDTVDAGQVWLGEVETSRLRDKDLTRLRRDRVGFVFQAFNLIPTLTARQNITLPAALAGRRVDPGRLEDVVEVLGLADRLGHKPHELSGGQQQRVAIARALVGSPDVIFADEPTGNLDSASGAEVLALLRRSVREMGQSVVMVTHDAAAASYADRVVLLADGRIAGDLAAPDPDRLLEALRGLAPRDRQSPPRPVSGEGEAAR